MIAITHLYTIPTGKNHFTGLHQEGYHQWNLTLTTPLEEKVILFRTSLGPQTRFAIAPRQWSSLSFEELIRCYSACNQQARTMYSDRMLFDRPVLSDTEIQQAVEIWTALS